VLVGIPRGGVLKSFWRRLLHEKTFEKRWGTFCFFVRGGWEKAITPHFRRGIAIEGGGVRRRRVEVGEDHGKCGIRTNDLHD